MITRVKVGIPDDSQPVMVL